MSLEGVVGETLGLLSALRQSAASAALMSRLDTLNQRYGTGIVKVAVALLTSGMPPWQGLSQQCSPAYTTSWEGLLQVRI